MSQIKQKINKIVWNKASYFKFRLWSNSFQKWALRKNWFRPKREGLFTFF